MDIIDNGSGQILCIILINFALQPIDIRAKYSFEEPDPDLHCILNTDLEGSIEYGSGRIRIRNTDENALWQDMTKLIISVYSIVNILLLRGKLTLPPGSEVRAYRYLEYLTWF